jgi:hypothetical protein
MDSSEAWLSDLATAWLQTAHMHFLRGLPRVSGHSTPPENSLECPMGHIFIRLKQWIFIRRQTQPLIFATWLIV